MKNITRTRPEPEIGKDAPKGIRLFDIDGNLNPVRNVMLEECCIVLCLEGSAVFQLNEKQYTLSRNMIAFISPHYLIRSVNISGDFRGKGLLFLVDVIKDLTQVRDHKLAEIVRKSVCVEATGEKVAEILESYDFLRREYLKPDTPLKTFITKSLLLVNVVKISEVFFTKYDERQVGDISRASLLTEQFFALVSENYQEQRSVTYYAEKMCLTRKYLTRVVKETTGRNPLTWINEHVVSKAKILIRTTDMTLIEISEQLNLPNSSFFGRLFKKHTGITPNDYRNTI